jgi:hypothetical protein
MPRLKLDITTHTLQIARVVDSPSVTHLRYQLGDRA